MEEEIDVVHLTLSEVNSGAVEMDQETGVLTLKETGQELAVIYYRTGYMPDNYTENGWKGRQILENSAAIKCPSVDLQLVTFKKVEERLSDSKFYDEVTQDLESIKHIFANKMWGFEDIEAVRDVIEDAKVNYDNYVLKTQREGGGNNYFGTALPELLSKEDELWQYSLMKRVHPIEFEAQLMNQEKIWQGTSVSELGIFGHILVDENGLSLANQEIGAMMRTKPATTNEGGVCAGYAYVDTPYRFEGTKEELAKGNLFTFRTKIRKKKL